MASGRNPHMLTCALAYAVAALGCSHWCVADELPVYRAAQPVSGTIRVRASAADGWLVEHLEAGFRKAQPGVTFSGTFHGPESTFAGVYTGVADVAFMAREMRVPMESMAFEWVHHYKAFEVEIANAGLGTERPGLDSVAALFIRTAVLHDSRKWNPRYREVATGWSEVLASLARDPAGIAYAPVLPGHDGTKSVALGADDGGPFYALSAQTVAA